MEIYATRAEIDDSQFFVWYRELQAVSIKSEIIPLSKSFIEYLQEDGIILPPHLDKFISSTDNNDEWDSEEDVDKDRNVETCQAAVSSIAPDWDFVDLDRDITLAMNRLGGEVFIKVNWSAPLDVSWMTMGSLKAFSLRDIYLQLKSSDRIIYDLEHMYDNCHDEGPKMPDQPVLVLRKWANLHPSMEFRLFVNEGNLVGVCQRDCCNFYPFLRSKIDDLLEILQRFYFANVAPKSLPRKFCMDVYIDKKDRVWVIDVNCFGLPSSSLLFEWGELESSTVCMVKIVENDGQRLQSVLGTKRGPIDVHMAPEFSKFMDICKQQQEEPSDGEQDD